MGTRPATTLARIVRRFAGAEAAVERAFEASESFRGLCRDYLDCVATLAHWQESEKPDAPLRVKEYRDLLDELTHEIERHLRLEGR